MELVHTAMLLAVFGALMAASVIASRTMEWLGVPVVLLFIFLGMLGGSEGILGIEFDDYGFAFRVGTVALILILFDGGLNTSLAAVRESIKPAGVLATVGVAGTAGLVAVFTHLLGASWSISLLLGAVVSSTDAAAVFAVLRGGNLNLRRRIGTTIELESGINDPMAVILTLAMIDILKGEGVNYASLLLSVPTQLIIGCAVGMLLGWGTLLLLQRMRLITVGFYPVLTLALAFLAFGLATLLRGSGFLAVYVAALVVGNGPLPYRSGLVRIHDAIGWLSQITMFLTLGLLVFPSQLWSVAPVGLLVALFLACIARPLVVALCLLPFGFSLRENLYVGWVGLRGAVPIILATFPVLAGLPNANGLFNVVFFVVVVSSIIPGATIRYVTRWLGLEEPASPVPLAALEVTSTRHLRGELMSFFVTDLLAVCHARVSSIPFPEHSSAVLLVRGEELVAPRGSTVLKPGDHVYIFSRPEDKAFIQFLFGRPQEHT